jgi:hypothetical protein
VPAPFNLRVPPYGFLNPATLVVGLDDPHQKGVAT